MLCKASLAWVTKCVLLANGCSCQQGVSASTRTCLALIPSLAQTLTLRDTVGAVGLTAVFFKVSQ